MSKKKKRRIKLCYKNWHDMCRDPKKNQQAVMWYFMGFWTAFTDSQTVEFIGLCTKKDREILMTYPLWQ